MERGSSFGELRSLVAQAMEGGRGVLSQLRWRDCRRQLMSLGVEHPEHELSLHYVSDHLDRFLEREPMVALHGSEAQVRWAKRLRLLTMQKLGVLQQETQHPVVQLECRFAKLTARQMESCRDFIDARDTIQGGSPQDLLEWLLGGW